jgi:protein-S-isoprenylcysteine O-methyltransferase Ste14
MTFLFLWFVFCVAWAGKALFLRKGRVYAKDRKLASTNSRFKFISYFAFLVQITLVPLCFYSDSFWLFKFHSLTSLFIFGFILCYLGLALYLWASFHLGRNYSPCFDSHVPFELVDTGPYKFIRHPGWLSKLLVSLGGILVSGSLWFIPFLIWITIEMRRTIRDEEAYLSESFPAYVEYRERTNKIFPKV